MLIYNVNACLRELWTPAFSICAVTVLHQGPNGENFGAITQPLPFSYCIFRAPSEQAGAFKKLHARQIMHGDVNLSVYHNAITFFFCLHEIIIHVCMGVVRSDGLALKDVRHCV